MPEQLTYRDLLELLKEYDEETLDQTVTIRFDGECYAANVAAAHEDDDTLDFNHIFLASNEEIKQYAFDYAHRYDI